MVGIALFPPCWCHSSKEKWGGEGYGGVTGCLDDSLSFNANTEERVEVLPDEKPGCHKNNGVIVSNSSCMYLCGEHYVSLWLNDLWMFDIDMH